MYSYLIDQLNPKHPLLQLAKRIPWETLEIEFRKFYALMERPAKPVRLMIGLFLIKQLKNMSDEHVVQELVSNPYYQAFCGIKEFVTIQSTLRFFENFGEIINSSIWQIWITY